MKKLISVFAALALVGSLAAQKGKKAPAKAPAAPAVAAPKAPAMPAAVTAAPAAVGAAKGIGLFIEGRGTFTLSNGTTDSKGTGDQTAASVDYKLASSSGFGGGATIGYEIVSNLGLVASFDYRSVKSRTWEQTKATVTVGTADVKASSLKETMVLGIGFRPTISALGGKFYAGAGFAYVLPYKDEATKEFSNASSALFTVTKQVETNNWNAAMGMYGELGYNYHLTDNLYLGIGARLLVTTANNDGKSQQTVNTTPTASTTTTVDYAAAAGGTTAKTAYKSDGTTDFGASVTVGVRF